MYTLFLQHGDFIINGNGNSKGGTHNSIVGGGTNGRGGPNKVVLIGTSMEMPFGHFCNDRSTPSFPEATSTKLW